ncbi:Ff.00g020270.m01.CDS01 [Fusarium sp. VM40]|nr:Ff.00g020270.m01.CDS01 [Fusarium sp. VM40]
MPAKYIFVRALRDSVHLNSNSKTHWMVWIGCTSATGLVAYIIASAIPIFGSLVSLIGALCITFLAFHPMACMWLYDNWSKGKVDKPLRWKLMVGCADIPSIEDNTSIPASLTRLMLNQRPKFLTVKNYRESYHNGGLDHKLETFWLIVAWPTLGQALFQNLPSSFSSGPAKWAFYSYQDQNVAVLQGSFNRSAMDAVHEAKVSNAQLAEANNFLNSTDFVAYDEKFFDIIGPRAQIKHVQHLAYQTHEAPCYNPDSKELFFTEWGPPGGDEGVHRSQYLLDTRTNKLRNITTSPPTVNVHGCVFYKDALYVVTDGDQNETGALIKLNPKTWKKTVLLNNYYQQPFMGFNDLDIDPEGNFWLTYSKSGAGRDIVPFTPPTNPTVYFVNGTTLRPRPVHITTGNSNGIAVASTDSGRVVYLPDTGVSRFKPVSVKDPYGDRGLLAYEARAGGVLTNRRLLNNPIGYFYDGIRVSRNGWIFVGSGDGVDVIDPDTGLALGSIRVGGGNNVAVSLAFGRHDLWIVGRGGVWHVSEINDRLDRPW